MPDMDTNDLPTLISELDYERLRRITTACDELLAMHDRFGDAIGEDRFLRHAVMRLCGIMVSNSGRLSNELRSMFPQLPDKEISAVKFAMSERNFDKDLSPIVQLVKTGAVSLWRWSFGLVLESCTTDDGAISAADEEVYRRITPSRGEYRSVMKDYLVKRVGRIDRFRYRQLSELVHDQHLSAYRTQLNVWYQSTPIKYRKRLSGRLLSSENHGAAISELFIYRLLSSQGWDVEPEPPMHGVLPDFLVKTPQGVQFYCEVTQLNQRLRSRALRAFEQLMHQLDNLDNDFLLSVDLHDWSDQLDAQGAVRRISQWLYGLPRTPGQQHELSVDEFGFYGSIFAIWRNDISSHHGNIFHWSVPSSTGRSFPSRLRRSMKTKSMRDKWIAQEEVPYVLALSSSSQQGLSEMEALRFLFGSFDLSYERNSSECRIILPRRGDPCASFAEDHYTRFSALLWHSHRRIENMMKQTVMVYHNPWARFPLPRETFSTMCQFYPVERTAHHVVLHLDGWQNKEFSLR